MIDRISRELNDEISTAAPHKIILSTEVLSRDEMPPTSLTILHKLLPDACFTWVLFLRAQDDLLISRYAEGIKKGAIGYPTTIWDLNDPNCLDHFVRLTTVDHATGNDIIVPVSYELAKRDLVGFFAEAAGFQISDTMTLTKRMNESLPWSVLYLLRYLNSAPRPLRDRPRRWVLHLMKSTRLRRIASLVSVPPPLSESAKAPVMQTYTQSNQKVADQFFGGKDIGFKLKASEKVMDQPYPD